MRETIAIIISILCLFWIFTHIENKPGTIDDHVASDKVKKIMQQHGTPVLECRGTVCSFKRDGKTVKVRL